MMSNEREQAASAETDMKQYFFRASAVNFKKILGRPIAYWISQAMLAAFERGELLKDIAIPRQGLATMDNARFTRRWHEVSASNCAWSSSDSSIKWFPYNKGGDFRRWYGNQEFVVNWEDSGSEIKSLAIERYGSASKRVVNEDSYFKKSITWSKIGSGLPSFRCQPEGAIFDVAGMSIFPSEDCIPVLLCFLNTKVALKILEVLSPTLNFEAGQVGAIPIISPKHGILDICQNATFMLKVDWDSYEQSWGFSTFALLQAEHLKATLQATYQQLHAYWRSITLEMQRLEEENNRIFIEAYGLQDELTAEVPLKEITLTCNPHYRYGGVKTEAELDAQLQSDTMAEFLSYAVGCMFGRYSLDKPGLVLANQGETLAEYLRQIPEPSFMPDEDNVIPLLDGEWFADDVTERFRTFLRVTFGEQHYEENLAFIEQSLGKDVRKYFIKDFYTDHVKRYKKRPIYWLFASPKGTFSALIYLHRYRPDTVSVVLQYLRDFRKKLAARLDYLQQVGISTSASQGEKTKANKEVETIKKQLLELDDYERDTLYPLATEQIPLDLDDGVKVNYLKLGPALKKIVGLDAKGDE